jgi:glycosyltransferase involved in cell wall biosynthesis
VADSAPNRFDHAVTVVTVAKNDLEGLRRTFASLDAQTFRDVQHIVIDGASTDGSVEWLRTAAVVPATIVVSEPDRGVYDAMNKGAAMATGELLTFLNAGDAYAHAGVLGNAVSSRLKVSWDWGFGLVRVVDQRGLPVRPVRPIRWSFRRHALGLISVPHQATFMRTQWFHQLGGFDDRYRLAADTDLLLRAGARSRPATWTTVDVEYATGGMSDRRVYEVLREKHAIRERIPGAALRPWPLDLLWMAGQIGTVAVRKAGKRLLNILTAGKFTTWWARGGR